METELTADYDLKSRLELSGQTNTSVVINIAENDSLSDYEYEYDLNDALSNISLAELVPVAIIYSFTLLMGVTGNLLVIFAIARHRRMHTVTNVFLTSLASADLMLVLLCVPIKFAKFFTFTWVFGAPLCKSVHYMQNVSVICSVLTLTMMSMERYYAILHPMVAIVICTVDRARKVVCYIWVASFLLATPILFGRILHEVGERYKAYWCIKLWPRPVYSQIYEVGMLLLVFVIPLAIMTFAYTSISRELWRMTSKRAVMRAGSDSIVRSANGGNMYNEDRQTTIRRYKTPGEDDRTRKQVIKMLVMVICLFGICWGPVLIDNVLVSFGILQKLNYGYLKYMRQAFFAMAYFNSCINPVVYCFMSRNFRESFKHALCSWCCPQAGTRSSKPSQQNSLVTRSSNVYMKGISKMELESLDSDSGFEVRNSSHTKKLIRNEKSPNSETFL